MNQSLSAYSEYKPAGLPWLVEVPAHWEIKRAKQVFRTIDQRSETGAEEKLTVSSKNGVVPRREQKVTMFMAASYVGHKLCWPGDLVVNSLWAWANGLGFAKHHGIISTAYSVYRPLPEYAEAGPYLDYLLRSSAFQWEFQIGSKGIWISRLQLTDDTFMRMPILLPPLPEQQRIVAFLDGKTRQIARLLRNKRQLIKLLTEQRQNVIQRAVLYGIEPDVKLKPSGVEWFTEVPAHWSVKKLKHLASVRSGIAKGKVYLSGEELVQVSYLRVANVQDGYLNLADVATIQVTKSEAQSYKLEHFDLLMNEGGDIDKLGRGTVWHGEIENCIHQNHVFALRPKPRTNVYFLNYFVGAPACKKYFQLKGKQTTNLASISSSAIAATPIALPPMEEQQAIVDYIERETKIIDQTISRAQREIELIQEYRTRLIADVVTGQVDVRHLAEATSGPELPAEDELDLEEEESEEELLIETEDGRD